MFRVLYSIDNIIDRIVFASTPKIRSQKKNDMEKISRSLKEEITYGYHLVNAQSVPADKTHERKVCIVDTGYQADHEDLPNGVDVVDGTDSFLDGEPFYHGESWDVDGEGHGTHVAGIIAAIAENNKGIRGIAPGVKLHIVKGLSNDGSGYLSTVLYGVSLHFRYLYFCFIVHKAQ